MDPLDIFDVIATSSVIGSVIAAIILVIKIIFNNKLTSAFHYYIWLILLIKLIVPFGPNTPLSISNIYDNLHVQSTSDENTKNSQINSLSQVKDTDLLSLIPQDTLKPSQKNIQSIQTIVPMKEQIHIKKILFLIWISGITLLIFIYALAYKKLRKIISSSISKVKNDHKEILHNCMHIMKIKSTVELLYSPKVNSPCLCGLIRPKILIPVYVAKNICDNEYKYIAMHELTHLKNKDIFINWILTLLSIIYWFNPILIYAFHKTKQDCEFFCDNKVISYLQEGENIQYGHSIIRVLEIVGRTTRLVGTTSLIMNNSEIKRRVIMISKYKKITIKSMLLGTVVLIIIGILGIMLNTSKMTTGKNSTLQAQSQVIASENKTDNPSNNTLLTTTEKLPKDAANSITPISSDIVIYNSHPDEDYPSGINITTISALINDKLVKEGLKSNFIKCTIPKDYSDSYVATRKLITENVKDYSNTILLDIHRDAENDKDSGNERNMLLILAKNNPHYESNKKFVDSIYENIKNHNEISSDIKVYNRGRYSFNQDLSNNSVLIEIGNNMSSDSDIDACVNVLVNALKDIHKS